jgi:Ca2+-binding EF-hand superfamily protein
MSREDSTKVSVDEVIRFVGNLSMESTRQQISHDDVKKFADTFRKCAGSKGYLDREAFGKMVSCKNVSYNNRSHLLHFLCQYLFNLQNLFIDRAFGIFDQNRDGRVDLDCYNETMAQLAGKNADAAIEFLFRIYDGNGDGCLEFEELKEVLKASMGESGMTFDDTDLDDLTRALWEDAGMNETDNKRMTFSDLSGQFDRHPALAFELADR